MPKWVVSDAQVRNGRPFWILLTHKPGDGSYPMAYRGGKRAVMPSCFRTRAAAERKAKKLNKELTP